MKEVVIETIKSNNGCADVLSEKITECIELEQENERLKNAIRKARDYQTPMGSSFNQWYEEIQKILGDALYANNERYERKEQG